MDCDTEFIEKNSQLIEEHNKIFNGSFTYHVIVYDPDKIY